MSHLGLLLGKLDISVFRFGKTFSKFRVKKSEINRFIGLKERAFIPHMHLNASVHIVTTETRLRSISRKAVDLYPAGSNVSKIPALDDCELKVSLMYLIPLDWRIN